MIVPPFLTLNKLIITISAKLYLVVSAVNSLYLGFFDLFRSILRSYINAAKNYCASCWEYPKNLDLFEPIALFSSEGVQERDVDDLIILIVLA